MAYQQAKEALNPVASISGTIQELYVHNGDSVNAGAQIAKITSSMDQMCIRDRPETDPEDREKLQHALEILRRGMGAKTHPAQRS